MIILVTLTQMMYLMFLSMIKFIRIKLKKSFATLQEGEISSVAEQQISEIRPTKGLKEEITQTGKKQDARDHM